MERKAVKIKDLQEHFVYTLSQRSCDCRYAFTVASSFAEWVNIAYLDGAEGEFNIKDLSPVYELYPLTPLLKELF
jgi:hypothetical protein